MKLAVISLNTESKNLSQYYNSQAEGLAKALAAMGHEMTVYHLIPDLGVKQERIRTGGVQIVYIRCRHIGKHALPDLSMMNADRLNETLLTFSVIMLNTIRGCLPL